MPDHPSLAQAFLQDRAKLLRYLRARGAGEQAEDYLQELWLKVSERKEDVIAGEHAYLMRMAHNLMLDHARSASRRRKREEAYGTAGEVDATPDALAGLIDRQRLCVVERAIDALGGRTSDIFRRHRLNEEPQRAIADSLGLSLSAVEKHLQRAYKAVAGLRTADRGIADD